MLLNRTKADTLIVHLDSAKVVPNPRDYEIFNIDLDWSLNSKRVIFIICVLMCFTVHLLTITWSSGLTPKPLGHFLKKIHFIS